MDEASIVNALQQALQNYKVKAQIRRKESQLHVLISRAEGDDVDYASLYDIVKRCIDKLPIEGADSLVVYGRLAGAKHPEWQKKADIRPPLPLIELDLDELEEFDDIGGLSNLSFPLEGTEETEIQVGNLKPNVPDDFNSFEESIKNDLKIDTDATGYSTGNDEIDNIKIEDFNLGYLDLEGLELDDLNSAPFELNNQASNQRSPIDKNDWTEEKPDLDATIISSNDKPIMAIPLPLPPSLPPSKRSAGKTRAMSAPTPQILAKFANENQRSHTLLLRSIAFGSAVIGILGVCGWLIWDRSVQQNYLENARSIENQNLNAKQITKLSSLTETRNQLQTAISQLEEISDRPASLYAQAQTELTVLRPKLEEFDRKISIEQGANKKLESAKNDTFEAAKLVQNPPHKSTVWKAAQEKRQQALKMLAEIPADSLLYIDAQNRLKVYSPELVQIGKWVEIQQRAESGINNIDPDIVNQIKQLKSKPPQKQQFLSQCKTILQPKLYNAEAQRVGFSVSTLSEYLCAYFWDS